mgnify:FL=1
MPRPRKIDAPTRRRGEVGPCRLEGCKVPAVPGSMYCGDAHRNTWHRRDRTRLAACCRELIAQGILRWDGRRLGVAVQLVIEEGGVRVVERESAAK